jgi:uncharacterized protein (TIGR04222 family)
MIEILYFLGWSLICIIIGWYWANADGTKMDPLPELTRFNALAIANLRGGRAAVIRTVVFSLCRRNLAEFGMGKFKYKKRSGYKKDRIMIVNKSSQKKVLSPIEKEIYEFLATPRRPRELIQDSYLRPQIEQHLAPIYREFEQLHLIRTEADHTRAWTATIIMAIVICAGGIRTIIRIPFHIIIPFLIIASLFVLFWVLKPWAPHTSLGRRYLKAIIENFGWVQESLKSGRTPEGIDAAFAIAIFGIGALKGVTAYSLLTKAFASTKSGVFGGGCGGCGGCGG